MAVIKNRLLPNIVITGTPGSGKTTHAQKIVAEFPELKNFQISEVAKKLDCYDGYDEARDTHIVDEDKLLDNIEPDMEKGGVVLDWHACDVFPERLIDLVIVLRCDNEILYDRLQKRGYKDSKIQENLDVEIMDVILQDAMESYDPAIVIELHSEDETKMEQNVGRLSGWIKSWLANNPKGVSNELESDSESDSDAESDQNQDQEEDGETFSGSE